MSDRCASLPDDVSAPLADRLLLALGMWPSYVGELGADEVVATAAMIKSAAHRYPMAAEDFGTQSAMRQELEDAVREAIGFLISATKDPPRDGNADLLDRARAYGIHRQQQGAEVDRALARLQEALAFVSDPDDPDDEDPVI
jgi:hypothetical protein